MRNWFDLFIKFIFFNLNVSFNSASDNAQRTTQTISLRTSHYVHPTQVLCYISSWIFDNIITAKIGSVVFFSEVAKIKNKSATIDFSPFLSLLFFLLFLPYCHYHLILTECNKLALLVSFQWNHGCNFCRYAYKNLARWNYI